MQDAHRAAGVKPVVGAERVRVLQKHSSKLLLQKSLGLARIPQQNENHKGIGEQRASNI